MKIFCNWDSQWQDLQEYRMLSRKCGVSHKLIEYKYISTFLFTNLSSIYLKTDILGDEGKHLGVEDKMIFV